MSYPSRISDNSDLYHYVSLKEPTHIRILHLKPGHDGDPLQGTIEHVDVNSDVTFSAISYVWGSQDTPYRMLLGDDQYVPLTKSLHETLQNLRELEGIGQKTFWADQVCINQENTDERNLQVAMMVTIYRKATRVITYIGPDTPNDHHGIRLAQKFNELSQQIMQSQSRFDAAEARSFIKNRLPGENDSAWDGYNSLTSRAWLNRLWMVQENVVNDNTIMVCGKTAFQCLVPRTEILPAFFDNFPERIKFVLYNRRDHSTFGSRNSRLLPLPSVGQFVGLRSWLSDKGSNSLPLLDLLRISRDFMCTDPRDKVYALLGLASDLNILQIQPDYARSPAEVFINTALRILQTGSNLDLLNHVGNAKEIELPSWVPDWSPPKSRFLLKPMFWSIPRWDLCASANTLPIYNFEVDHSVLIVHGAVMDSIRCNAGDPSINASLLAQDPDLALVEYPCMMGVLQKICEDFQYQPTLENIPADLIDHLSRTVIADRPLDGDLADRQPSACFLAYLNMCRFHYEVAVFRRNGGSCPPEQPDITTQVLGSKFSNYSVIAEGRSLCVTRNDRLCLAPPETKVGDIVAIFYGGKTAYILRPVREDFEIIGEAYVHGLMKGEALEDPKFQNMVRKIRLV